MLIFESFPMHRNHGMVQLADVLSMIVGNELEWSILDFHGVGEAPNGMAMPDFEKLVISTPRGYRLSWRSLIEFARGLHQTLECLIVGAPAIDGLSQSALDIDDFRGCEAVIEAFDSTEWKVGLSEFLRRRRA